MLAGLLLLLALAALVLCALAWAIELAVPGPVIPSRERGRRDG